MKMVILLIQLDKYWESGGTKISIQTQRLIRAWGEINYLKQTSPELKPNFSQLARETGVCRQTLSKMWHQKDGQTPARRKKPSQFDPYYEEIKNKYLSCTSSTKAIFKYFQMRYPDTVFKSYDSFKSYVRKESVKRGSLKSFIFSVRIYPC
jgi:hypothetical protein